jgi:hypothetical protein
MVWPENCNTYHSDTQLVAVKYLANLFADEHYAAKLELECIQYLTYTPRTPI